MRAGPKSAHRFLAAALLIPLYGCAPRIASPPDGPVYDVPDPNPATYTFADTATLSVEAGMGAVTARTVQEGTAELQFRRDQGGLRVQLRFPTFRGSFENPSQGIARTDEDDIAGPLVVALDYQGRVEVVDTPSLSPAFRGMSGPETLARPFFIRFPGRAVRTGARWVDTVVTHERRGGMTSVTTSVVTSRLAGDTVMAGRTLLRILTTSETELVATGVSGGVAVEQRLAGVTRGRILWDDGNRVLVERTEEGSLSGTLSMPETGAVALPISLEIRRAAVLRP